MKEQYSWSVNNIKYGRGDIVNIGCNDCNGCCSCCYGMGDTIIQDPYDLFNFCSHMRVAGGQRVTFELLISEDGPWELSYQDGVTLPNIKMVEDGHCPFLGENGRCSIHPIRSGLCRLFPLARVFEPDKTLSYLILNSELGCKKLKNGADPVLISNWIGIEDLEQYESFQINWHDIKLRVSELCAKLSLDRAQKLRQQLLDTFYMKSYDRDFYEDFNRRSKVFNEIVEDFTK